MADKKFILFIGLLIFILLPLPAQNYFIDRSGDEPIIIQRVRWVDSEYASRYVVIIESLDEETNHYTEIERIETYDSFVQVSLPAGHYRYKIEVYDLLDKYAFTTDYQDVEIIQAYLPEIISFSPQRFFLDEDFRWVITIRGHNFLPNSEVYLLEDNVDEANATKIYPIAVHSDGDTARLEFAVTSLIPGDYGIYIVNPGGLDSFVTPFQIAYVKAIDFNISLGYSPLVPINGHLFSNDRDYQAPFPKSIYLLSGGLRASVLPLKRHWGHIGFEVTGSLSFLDNETEHYSTQALFYNVHIAAQFQKYFFRRNMAFNFAIGGGITGLANFHYEYVRGIKSEQISAFYPSIIGGTSLMIFFKKPFYIQPGIDFIQMITPDSPASNFIRPYINVGVRF